MKRIDLTAQKQRELEELVRKGSVQAGAAKRLMDDYMNSMLKATEEFFEAEKRLEDLRAELKVNIEQKKRASLDTSSLERQVNQVEQAYLSIDPRIWVKIALSTLAIFVSAWKKGDLDDEKFKMMRETYKKFLDSMTEKWNYQKKSLEDKVGELEKRTGELEERLEELRVRYKVGEYEKATYDALAQPIQLELDQMGEEKRRISEYIDAIDSAIFDCYYVYSHPQEKGSDVDLAISVPDLPSLEEVAGFSIAGRSVDEMYEKLFNYYSLNLGPDRAKSRLENEIRRYTSQGTTRSAAIAALYKSVMGD
ncbi:CdvA-like protein [Tardisphaera miroshnichenkoae]